MRYSKGSALYVGVVLGIVGGVNRDQLRSIATTQMNINKIATTQMNVIISILFLTPLNSVKYVWMHSALKAN